MGGVFMNLKQLEYFITIVDEGNISTAAKKLHMSQPPLSKQIHLLEDEFNCILFERGARKIQLTEAGRMLYNRASIMLEMCRLAKKELIDYSNGKKGVLRFGIVSSVSDIALSEWISDFHNEYPDISFEISEANTYELIDMLSANLIELAIVRTPFQSDGIEIFPLKKETMNAVGNKMFFKNLGERVTLKDIADKPLIFYRRWESVFNAAFAEADAHPNIFCINDDARTTAAWADRGLGVGILPESAKILLKNKNTETHEIDNDGLLTEIYIVVHKNAYRSEIVKTFIDFVKNKSSI